MARSGPIVIAYDGTPSSEHAIRASGELLGGRRALVIVVYRAGLGFELVEAPSSSIGLPLAPLDVRTAAEVDQALAENARRLAEDGARLAREAGFDAEGLAIADQPYIAIAETIVTASDEHDSQAIVVGAHSHGRLSEVLLGSTSRDVIRRAGRPVVVVREADER